jgi:ABC-type lipoprotein release transport system permease subunit
VGRRLRLVTDRNTEASLRSYQTVSVIGIARDEISRWIFSGDERALVYLPGSPQSAGSKLLVRVHGDAETTKRRLEAEITAINPNAIEEIRKIQIQEWVREEAYSFRVAHWGMSAIGALALSLTLSGIYGLLSYLVSQRTKEIGIRMAMGANTRSIAGLVLRQSMRLAIIGTAFGGVLALGVARILASNLFMLNALDGAAYIGGALLVLTVCAAAAYFPSRRAARIDPIRTLRYD